jgi:hypothetical protein
MERKFKQMGDDEPNLMVCLFVCVRLCCFVFFSCLIGLTYTHTHTPTHSHTQIHSPRSSRPTSSESKVRFSPEAGVDAQVYEFNVVGSELTHTQKQGRGVNKLYDDLSMWISKLYAH